MASRLAHPGVLAFLSGLKGATGAMVSERDRRRALQEKESDRARAFQDNLVGMSIKQKMDQATKQQNDMAEEARLRDRVLWERSLPLTEPQKAEMEYKRSLAAENTAQAENYRINPPQTPEQRAQAAANARIEEWARQTYNTALNDPDPERGITLLRGNVKILGKEMVDQGIALLKERQQAEEERKDRATGLTAIATARSEDDARRLQARFKIPEAEFVRIRQAGEPVDEEAQGWLEESAPGYDPNAQAKTKDELTDAERLQIFGAPAVPGATNPQEAQDWAAKQGGGAVPPRGGGAVPPLTQGGAGAVTVTPADIAEFRAKFPDQAGMTDAQIIALLSNPRFQQ